MAVDQGIRFFSVLCIVCLSVIETQGMKCPGTFTLEGTRCYKFLDIETEWILASDYCNMVGHDSRIPQIENAAQQQELESFLQGHHGTATFVTIWLGGSDIAQHGHFMWDYNTPFTFTNWDSFQTNYGQANCVGMDRHGGWKKQQCTTHNSVVCVLTPEKSEIVG